MPHKEKLKVQKKINLIRWCQAGKTEASRIAGLEDRRGQWKKDQTLRTEPEEAQIEIERLGEFSNRCLLEIGRNPHLVMRSGVKFCVSEIRQRQEEVRWKGTGGGLNPLAIGEPACGAVCAPQV
jgi:hypothetical protein